MVLDEYASEATDFDADHAYKSTPKASNSHQRSHRWNLRARSLGSNPPAAYASGYGSYSGGSGGRHGGSYGGGSGGSGAGPGFGGTANCCCNNNNGFMSGFLQSACSQLDFGMLALSGAAFGLLYTAVTMNMRKRKRRKRSLKAKKVKAASEAEGDDEVYFVVDDSDDEGDLEYVLLNEDESEKGVMDSVLDMLFTGLEEFEDKVDKLAHGQGDENSWIGNLYHKFKGSFMGGEDNTIEQDGLEPPILDDKWGLGDVHTLFSENNSTLTIDNSTVSTNVTEHAISKRSLEDEDAEFLEETAEDDEFVKSLSGESKCRTKFWRCVGKVAKGSIHYMQEPGGISGAFQKTMFRMAFHGGFGNVWNALMTIPEARRVKRCLNAQEECLSYEALRLELDAGSEFADEHTNKQRLIVNPELVENQDTSDGSEQFSPEVQAALDNNEI